VTGQPFGVDPTTPRDGSTPNPFERDTTIFKRGAPSGCGKTKQSGALDCTQEATKQIAASGGKLPTSSGGEIAVTMHQVNQDGAGPMKAFVDPTGTGNNFQTAKVNSL
jgi:Egh16-like virulence factor